MEPRMLIKKQSEELQKHTFVMASCLQYEPEEDSRVFLSKIQRVPSMIVPLGRFILMEAICPIYKEDVQTLYIALFN